LIPVAGKIVDWAALLEVAYFSLGAGLGVAFAFSMAVAGTTRFADEMRENRLTRAIAYGAVAVIGFLLVLAAIAFGIVVMTAKD
jgi:hypothetical protein